MQSGELLNLRHLDTETGFRHFDLGLTEKQHETVAKMRVGDTGSYDNFGDIGKIETDALKFFETLGNAPSEAKEQAAIVARLVERTIAGFESETAWVTIRALQPTNAFDVPRWHTDGYFYPPDAGDQVKAVITLKGDGTLLNKLPKEKRADLMNLQRSSMDEMDSREQRAALIESSRTETTPAGCGTVFIVGSEHATVHSEPPIRSERIFISVLPGSREQIENLRQNWNRNNKTEITLSNRAKNSPIIETKAPER